MQSQSGRKRGFTLVEIMVAITILVVIVLLFGQMLGIMSKAWTYGHGRANNFTKARAMLDLLAQDLQSGVFRPDLAAFPSGSSGTGANPPVWEFYTYRPGIPAGTTASALRSISIVAYTLSYNGSSTSPSNTYDLQRTDCPILWSNEATIPLFGASPFSSVTGTFTARDTAPGVIAFDIIFIQSDGTFSTTYTPISSTGTINPTPTRAVSVSLAVIDDLTMKQLSASELSYLNTHLVLPATPTQSVKASWDAYLNGTSMPWSTYPKNLGSSLATFERYIVLPNAP